MLSSRLDLLEITAEPSAGITDSSTISQGLLHTIILKLSLAFSGGCLAFCPKRGTSV